MFQLHGCIASYLWISQAIKLRLIALSVLVSISFPAFAININEIEISEKDGVYHIYVAAEISVEEKYVRQVLTDYAHIYRLNSSVIESKVFDSKGEGDIEIKSRLLLCNSLFCKEVTRVDVISILDSGDIQAIIVPNKSDFRSGKSVWKIIPMGNKTQLIYSGNIEPDFFIPPVVGVGIVKNRLHTEFSSTFARIEDIAQINEKRDWGLSPVACSIGTTSCKGLLNSGL